MTVLATMACTVSSAGISRPALSDILDTLRSQFQAIYGADSYIDPDSQDGQMLAAVASAIDDCNAATVAAYNGYSPQTAQGVGLSNAVKINGIARQVPSNSTASLTCVGNVGTTVTGGIAQDSSGNQWTLPTFTIPAGGSIVVTATCSTPGAIAASAGTIAQIATPVLGWASVTNAAAAAVGAPVETDAALRQRQAVSTANPSTTVLDGILGGILNLPGVTQAKAYENDGSSADSNGLVAHSIALVVSGGVDASIAQLIQQKKAPGCSTNGTTTISVTDAYGIGPYSIKFYRPTQVRVIGGISIKAKTGYTSAIGAQLLAAVTAAINALPIGRQIDLTKLFIPAQLYGTSSYDTFELVANGITLARFGGALTAADLAIAFNEEASAATSDFTLTVS